MFASVAHNKTDLIEALAKVRFVTWEKSVRVTADNIEQLQGNIGWKDVERTQSFIHKYIYTFLNQYICKHFKNIL